MDSAINKLIHCVLNIEWIIHFILWFKKHRIPSVYKPNINSFAYGAGDWTTIMYIFIVYITQFSNKTTQFANWKERNLFERRILCSRIKSQTFSPHQNQLTFYTCQSHKNTSNGGWENLFRNWFVSSQLKVRPGTRVNDKIENSTIYVNAFTFYDIENWRQNA